MITNDCRAAGEAYVVFESPRNTHFLTYFLQSGLLKIFYKSLQ